MKDIADTTNVKIDLRNEINVLKQQEILYQCEKEDNIKELKKQKDYNNGLKDIVIKYRNVLNSITSNIHDHEKIANIIRKEQDNFEKNNFNFV